MRAEILRVPKPLGPAGLALAVCLLLLAPEASAESASPAADGAGRGDWPARVLILHDSPEPPSDVAVMENLLAHFRATTTTAHSSALDGLSGDEADFIIHFDSAVASGRGPGAIAAIAREWNIPYMAFAAGSADEAYSGILIRYRDAEYPTTAIPAALLETGTDGAAIAWLSDGREERPLIVKSGDRWQVAAGLANRLVSWLVADVLHDFLGVYHPDGANGLLIIENVNPLSDPDRLLRLADLLREYRIPFVVAVEPVRRSSNPGERGSVADNPKLADALRYMTEAGGTVVLDGSRLGPDDPDESARLIARDIASLHEIGGYPVALYASGALTQSLALASERVYFSSAIEYSDFRMDGTRYSDIPYTRIRGADGTVIPESVGAASGDAAVDTLISRASRLRMVRDALVGVGLDAGLPYETAAAQVERIAREPVMWMDIRYTAYRVETGFIRLSGRGDGTMDAAVLDRGRMAELQKSEKRTAWFESVTYYSSWMLVLIVGGFVATFMLFIVFMQMRRNRRLFMERELE